MPTILLTRPADDSEELAFLLSEHGYEGVIEPMLKIRPFPSKPPEMTNLNAVMLTSAHALDFLDAATAKADSLFPLPCFCVGSHTADAAKLFGFQDVRDAEGDGMALAGLIGKSLPPASNILHIAGRDADGRTREELQRLGFNLRVLVTYVAEAAESLSGFTIRQFREHRIDAALLYSTRTAATLKSLILHYGLEACCGQVIAIGISDSVTAALGGLPWRRVEAAPMPSENAVLQCLQTLLPVSEVP